MNYLHHLAKYDTVEHGLSLLQQGIELKNSLVGSVYKEAIHKDLGELSRLLVKKCADGMVVYKIMTNQT